MATIEKLKVSAYSWDSSKDPNGGFRWLENLSSMVGTTQYGEEIESFLDMKLERNVAKPATVPT